MEVNQKLIDRIIGYCVAGVALYFAIFLVMNPIILAWFTAVLFIVIVGEWIASFRPSDWPRA